LTHGVQTHTVTVIVLDSVIKLLTLVEPLQSQIWVTLLEKFGQNGITNNTDKCGFQIDCHSFYTSK